MCTTTTDSKRSFLISALLWHPSGFSFYAGRYVLAPSAPSSRSSQMCPAPTPPHLSPATHPSSVLCSALALFLHPCFLTLHQGPTCSSLLPHASFAFILLALSLVMTPHPSLSFRRVGSRDRVSLLCRAKKGAEACPVALTSLASRVS